MKGVGSGKLTSAPPGSLPGAADERTGGQLQATALGFLLFAGMQQGAKDVDTRYLCAKLQQPLRIQANRRHVPAST